MRFTGNPAAPSTAQPGDPAGAAAINAKVQAEAQAEAADAAMRAGGPSSVPGILAGHAAANQQAARSAMGYSAGGVGYAQGGINPNTGAQGFNAAGFNPWGQYANPTFGSPAFYLRNIQQNTQQTATNTAAGPGIVHGGGMGGGGGPPGGPPNVPNFGWGGGGPGPGGRAPHVPNFGWMGGGGGGGNTFNYSYPGSAAVAGGGGGGFGGGNALGTIGSWVGLGATGRAAGSALGMAGRLGAGMAIGAEIGREMFFLPQTIAGMEGSWLGKTEQARRYIEQTSTMGQTGGFNSVDFRTRLRAASDRGPNDWLLQSGLGADEVAQMVGALGVAPRSTEQATGVGRNMALSRITPGMSGIPTNMLTGMMRDMLGVGATTLDRVGPMNQEFGAIMKQTAQTGQDQLRVLRSIDTGVVTLSSTSGATAAISPQSLFQANQRFMSLPEGFAGVAGERAITTNQEAFSTVGQNPARTIVTSGLVDKLRSEEDLRKFFGNDAWEQFTSGGVGREMADRYLHDIKTNNRPGAIFTMSRGFMQDPTLSASAGAQGSLINNAITSQYGKGGGLELATQSTLSGKSEAEVIAFNQSQRKGLALGTAANNPLNLSYAGQPGAIGSVAAADKQQVAVFPDMPTGIAASINQMRRYEQSGLMSVRDIARKWSGSNASEAYIKAVADSIGVSPDTKVDLNNPDVARAYVQGAQPFETGPNRLSQADLNTGVDIAFGRRSANPNFRAPGEADPNVPSYLSAVGTAKSDVLGSYSERTLRQGENLNNNVNAMSDAWRGIVLAVEGLASAVRAAATMSGSTPLNAPS
jgi:hypothetical protein